MYRLTSKIGIGKFTFSGVAEVSIKRSVHTISDTASIVIPAEGIVVRDGKIVSAKGATAALFKTGDEVTIDLGYDDANGREFTGFVRQVVSNMPTRIECEGYGWLLKQNKVTIDGTRTTLMDLLNKIAGAEASISVESLSEMTFDGMIADGKSGFNALKDIFTASGENLIAFFKGKTLCCGLINSVYGEGRTFSNTALVKYILGQNTVSYDKLQQHQRDEATGNISYFRKLVTGETINGAYQSDAGNGRDEKKGLNKIADKASLKKAARERGIANTYDGLAGKFETFLQPFVEPGDKCSIVSERRPELEGTYLVATTEVSFGKSGARRTIEPGIRIGSVK